jgi:hypothetical protein
MHIDNETDIEIFIWWVGHHSGGGCKLLYVLCEDSTRTAILEEQEEMLFDAIKERSIIKSAKHAEKKIENFDDSLLRELLITLSFNIFNGPEYIGFGSNMYGAKISIDSRAVTFEWSGRADNFDTNISKIFQYVREI